MDVSKLPRLSKTEGQAPSTEPHPPEAPIPAQPVDSRSYVYNAPGPRLAEAWISIGLGLIFVFVFPEFTQWCFHEVFHTNFPYTNLDENGAEIEYTKSAFFFSQLCMSVF